MRVFTLSSVFLSADLSFSCLLTWRSISRFSVSMFARVRCNDATRSTKLDFSVDSFWILWFSSCSVSCLCTSIYEGKCTCTKLIFGADQWYIFHTWCNCDVILILEIFLNFSCCALTLSFDTQTKTCVFMMGQVFCSVLWYIHTELKRDPDRNKSNRLLLVPVLSKFRHNAKAFANDHTNHLFPVPIISAQCRYAISERNSEHLRYDFV